LLVFPARVITIRWRRKEEMAKHEYERARRLDI
jgi:hypothetical protein